MADEKSPEDPIEEKGTEEEGAEEESIEESVSAEAASAEKDASKDAEKETEQDLPKKDEPPTVESLTEALYEADTLVAEMKDQALRAKAEVENMRRRAARDVENAHKYALENFTGELLPVLDSLEKAVESAAEAEDAGAIGEGVELSLKMFLNVLNKVGIEQIDPLGEPFNPQFHEAIAMVENPDGEPNSVMEVIQRGYSLNNRLVRAAKVVVVKAPSSKESSDEG